MNTSVEKIKNEYFVVPDTDIYETDNGYTLKMEMPGVTKENLDIEVHNGQLEVTGTVEGYSDENVKYAEYDLYNFSRKFKVGRDIDVNNIEAAFNNGVLTLTLNKAELKPKKIQISVQ